MSARFRTAALALLAGRDFARRELTARLIRKGFPEDTVDAVVERLAAERLQDEGDSPSNSSPVRRGGVTVRSAFAWSCASGAFRTPRPKPRSMRAASTGTGSPVCNGSGGSPAHRRGISASVQNRHDSCSIAGFPRTRSAPPLAPGDPTAETAAEAAGSDDDLEP